MYRSLEPEDQVVPILGGGGRGRFFLPLKAWFGVLDAILRPLGSHLIVSKCNVV